MEYLHVYASIALIHLLAIGSPGPTFMVVASHAAHGGPSAGFRVVLGVMAATLVWIALAVTGIGGVLAGIGVLDAALRYGAAAYLAWMGVAMLQGALRGGGRMTLGADTLAGWAAMRAGFRVNIANPKVVLYYASLFGAVIPAGAPPGVAFGVGATALLVSLSWWSTLTLLFGLPAVRRGYARTRRPIDAAMGVLLLAIAARILAGR